LKNVLTFINIVLEYQLESEWCFNILEDPGEKMDTNPYLMEKWSEAFQQQRLAEAEQSRLLHEARSTATPRLFWRWLALILATALIATGQHLQKAAEPQSPLACETC
jgi:hypothetical protein